jgi:hypothetical protein
MKWRNIPAHPNYQVSDKGLVRNKKTKRILADRERGPGYRSIMINGVDHYVHRLVLSVWVTTPSGSLQANHKDLDKTNNSVENLEWVTSKENYRHWVHYEYVLSEKRRGQMKINFEYKMT